MFNVDFFVKDSDQMLFDSPKDVTLCTLLCLMSVTLSAPLTESNV